MADFNLILRGGRLVGVPRETIELPPIGVPFWWPGSTPPTGAIKANGALLSRTTYAALFERYGTMFGAGDGTTTFQIVDLRGEFIRGWDDGRGVDSGRVLGSAQGDAIKSHNHTWAAGSATGAAGFNFTAATTNNVNTNDPATNSTGGAETRPRNTAWLGCIRY